MEENVILSAKVYADVLTYLSTTQLYKNVAKLISSLIRDAADNSNKFTLTVTDVEEYNDKTTE